MQVLGVHAESNGTQRLVRVTEPANPIFGTRVLPSREEAASSYFFNTFHWAPFWRPLLLSATKGNFPEINKFCLQALTCGYMGLCLGDEALKVKGQQLYGRVLSGVQFLLSQPAKAELAKLGFSMIIMGMYEVSLTSHCNIQSVPTWISLWPLWINTVRSSRSTASWDEHHRTMSELFRSYNTAARRRSRTKTFLKCIDLAERFL